MYKQKVPHKVPKKAVWCDALPLYGFRVTSFYVTGGILGPPLKESGLPPDIQHVLNCDTPACLLINQFNCPYNVISFRRAPVYSVKLQLHYKSHVKQRALTLMLEVTFRESKLHSEPLLRLLNVYLSRRHSFLFFSYIDLFTFYTLLVCYAKIEKKDINVWFLKFIWKHDQYWNMAVSVFKHSKWIAAYRAVWERSMTCLFQWLPPVRPPPKWFTTDVINVMFFLRRHNLWEGLSSRWILGGEITK